MKTRFVKNPRIQSAGATPVRWVDVLAIAIRLPPPHLVWVLCGRVSLMGVPSLPADQLDLMLGPCPQCSLSLRTRFPDDRRE